MTEAAAEGENVLLEPCNLKSCDAIRCPSPLPCVELHSNQKEEEEEQQQKLCSQLHPKRKVRPRGKLVRSMAVCEDDGQVSLDASADTSRSRQDGETTLCQEEEPEKSADPKKRSLPKESGGEYTDSTGIDLHQFIVDTLNSNPRDRMMLLKLEQDMIDFITSNSPFKKFPHMSSYHRMLVHRVAAYFGMEHNVDQTGKSVIINRTSSTRIPERRFLDEVHKDKTDEMHHWKAILKRDNSSDGKARLHLLREKQSKSMEEREEEYQRARDRIFSQEPLGTQENTPAEIRAAEEYNPYAETQRRRQLFRGSRDSSGSSWTGSSRQSSMEADGRYSNDPRPWSSTDSDSSYHWTNPPAAKPRQAAAHTWDTRGSGTVTLFRVSSTCPHPSSPPIPEEPDPNSAYIMDNGIPPGSILVNPHTGQPFLNPDGTPAVYNPPDSQQPIRSQAQQQVVQSSSVSYAAPQVLPVAPSQPFTTIEDLSSQFAHVTVSCQSTGEAPPLYPPGQGYIYAAPPLPPPSNLPSYCQPQVPVYYYGQYPTSAQHVQSQHVRSQAPQQTAGCAPAVGMQQSSYGQPQAMLGTYSPLASHQCSMVQGGMTASYPPSKLLTGIGGEAGYCCVVPPPHASCHPPGCTNLSAPAWSAQY